MKKIKLMIALSTTLIVTLSTGQLAAEEKKVSNNTKTDKGVYVGANIQQSTLKPRINHSDGKVTNENGTGYKVYAGYQINKMFGFEGFYSDLGSAKFKIGDKKHSVDYSLFGFSGVVTKPITKKVNAFAKAGYAKIENKVSDGLKYKQVKGNNIFGGLGLDYSINDRLSVRGEYEYFDKDIQAMSVGLSWKTF